MPDEKERVQVLPGSVTDLGPSQPRAVKAFSAQAQERQAQAFQQRLEALLTSDAVVEAAAVRLEPIMDEAGVDEDEVEEEVRSLLSTILGTVLQEANR